MLKSALGYFMIHFSCIHSTIVCLTIFLVIRAERKSELCGNISVFINSGAELQM